MTPEFAILLQSKLSARGYAVFTARNLNKSAGNGVSGFPKWQESARTHMEAAGFPSSIWNPSGFIYRDQDIICRPNYANYLAADLLISIHTNGGGGTGTETWFDGDNGMSSESEVVAGIIHNKVIAKIRSDYSPTWKNRGLKNSKGAYGEIRRANVPAFLIEVAFHDLPADNTALQNAAFRDSVATAMADGVDEYFGNAGGQPDLTLGSNVVVSPTTAAPGGTIRVDWTEKNIGTGAGTIAHNTRLHLSTAAYGTTYPIGSYSSAVPLAAGASVARFDDAVGIPLSIPPGSYFVTAFIDFDGKVAESSEANNIGSTSPNKIIIVADTTKPVFSAFAVSPLNMIQGSSVTVSYTVSDGGGSGLAYTQLWRTTDSSGVPNPSNWSQVGSNKVLSGIGPTSSSFSDTPPAGIYWYRLHAADQAGNLGNQEANGRFTPRKVTVAAPTRVIGLSGTMAFGEILVGTTVAATMKVSNAGNSPLTVSSITYPAGFSGDWSNGTIAPGSDLNVIVTFAPTSAVTINGTVVVNSNKTSGIYTIAISGSGITGLQAWRKSHFGSIANSGDGADLHDFDNDGIPNLLEFAFGLNPAANSAGLLPVPQKIGGEFVVTFNQPSGVDGVTYGAEWSETLLPDSWIPILNSSVAPLHAYRVPIGTKSNMYMRLKATNP